MTKIEEAFYAGARAFMSNDKIARPHQEEALPLAYEAWRENEAHRQKEAEATRPRGFPRPLTSFRQTGWCGVEGCGLPQYRCPSGPVCDNGHGGAPTLPADPALTG